MNRHYAPYPFYPYPPINYPNYFYFPPNPIFRNPMYPAFLQSYPYTRNPFMISQPSYAHAHAHVPFGISRRPPIKTAQSNSIVITEEPKEIIIKKEIPAKIEDLQVKKLPSTGKTLQISNTDYEYLEKKVCEDCRERENDDQLLLCDYCDDAYHTYCLKPILVEVPTDKEIWACPLCQKELENIQKMEKTNREIEYDKLRSSNSFYVLLDPNFKNNGNSGQVFQNGQLFYNPNLFTMNYPVKRNEEVIFN